MAAVAEWYRHRIVAGFVTSSSPVPLKTRRVGQRCTLNLSRAEMSSRWCGVVVRRGGASSVPWPYFSEDNVRPHVARFAAVLQLVKHFLGHPDLSNRACLGYDGKATACTKEC
ncbi:uncharacterized protein TNCV_3414141 [Trichonephila clavipes]|uniref:Uncharacterized protein n=1 Tax=Trichonephila clavipes TaxID=2585209 RepID=A0A8X6V3T7_TRICX|nr:uncharacterized protein TNCV_3414141 [Trichonephila clavipes]